MIEGYFLKGTSFRVAPVELRERLALSGERLRGVLKKLKSLNGVEEAVIISTCNRVEFYLYRRGEISDTLDKFLSREFQLDEKVIEENMYVYDGKNAAKHLFQVASSLDSMVLGEPQILSQVKSAYSEGVAAGSAGKAMSALFHHAFKVGKRVRTETGIGALPTSVSHIAVHMAERIFGDLSRRKAAVIGAGEMGAITAKELRAHGVQDLVVASRTLASAEDVIEEIGAGLATTYRQLMENISRYDVIITAAGSPTHLITTEIANRIVQERKGMPVFIIDISIPRVVSDDVGEIEGIFLYDIDDLVNIADENRQLRLMEAEKAKEIVDEELEKFLARTREININDLLKELYMAVRKIIEEEYRELVVEYGKKKEFTEDLKNAFVESLTKKLMHFPTTRLKQAAREGRLAEVSEIMESVFGIRRRKDES